MALSDVHGQLYGPSTEKSKQPPLVAFSALKNSGWAEAIASGTKLEVQVRERATCHRLTVQQIRRWSDGSDD